MTPGKKISTNFAIGLLAVGTICAVAPSAHATTPTSTVSSTNATEGSLKYLAVNDSQAIIGSNEFDLSFNDEGKAIATDTEGNSEVLPEESVDQNGNQIFLKYEDNGNNELLVSAIATTEMRSVGQCLTGIGGGAVTGAGTLGLAGAAVGTVTLPVIGTVGAGGVGTVVGGVGGGLTGAAASCFG
ncbi:Pathogenicity island protein [Rothia aerolata]|uniref:Pathogenicity island protein n=1 Tax=Rothia aerolata TaxID=1812262 RepID=A0A917IXC7_9MICC|nr:Pathogenicity island protein [Rothia aerolata]GGH66221.1 hypothetical protein GCM10007359_20230 [Rothia aerolata]